MNLKIKDQNNIKNNMKKDLEECIIVENKN